MTDADDTILDGAPSGETPEDNRETPWAASGWMDPVPQNTQPPRVREIPPAISEALDQMRRAFYDSVPHERVENVRKAQRFAELAILEALSGPPSGQESPGGAAPDFQKAREALDRFDKYHGMADCSCVRCQDAARVRATLDQAEATIARLRAELRAPPAGLDEALNSGDGSYRP